MKKLLCLILVVFLSVSAFAACTNNQENNKNENDIVSQDESNTSTQKEEITISSDASASEDTKKDTSENDESKKDSKNGNSQDFYLILNGTNGESITYHTEKCPLLKDKEIQKTSWEMITILQFRHCSKCNPPKYKGYVE